MAVAKTLLGTSYNIPETNEKPWGATMTALIGVIVDIVNAWAGGTSTSPLLAFASADSTLAAAATLTPTKIWHRIDGSGGAVTLDVTTAIADGDPNGQFLVLSGTHATNTVTIQDAANTNLNGHAVIGLDDVLVLIWDNAASHWKEIGRSN